MKVEFKIKKKEQSHLPNFLFLKEIKTKKKNVIISTVMHIREKRHLKTNCI